MKIIRPLSSLILVSIFTGLSACGSSGDDDKAGFDPLTDSRLLPVALCTALHLNGITRLTERVQQLFDRINGDLLPTGITENILLSEYTVELDLEPDGATDITVDVEIIPGVTNINDGLQDGEVINLTFNFMGTIAGSGSVMLSFGSGMISLFSGSLNLNDGGTCSFQTPNLNIFWIAGNLDSTTSNFPITAMDSFDTLNASLFGDADSVTVFGQLTAGANAPINAGFVVDLNTFAVFDD
jgi:hypothetical protein